MINALESLNLTQESQSNARRWVGMCVRELAQLKRFTSMSKYQERSSHGWPTHIYRDTPSNRVVGQITGAPDAPTPMHRMHPAASGAPIAATCPCTFKDQWSSSYWKCSTPTLSIRCSPVRVQNQFWHTGCVRWHVIGRPSVRCELVGASDARFQRGCSIAQSPNARPTSDAPSSASGAASDAHDFADFKILSSFLDCPIHVWASPNM
jgi:hypothetical protein